MLKRALFPTTPISQNFTILLELTNKEKRWKLELLYPGNVHGPTKRISWLLAHLLQPLLANVPAHLESSLQLIHRIQNINSDRNREFPYPFSLDVVALYTSIPVNEAIENVSNICTMGHSINHFSKNDISELLTIIIKNVSFTFNSVYIKKLKPSLNSRDEAKELCNLLFWTAYLFIFTSFIFILNFYTYLNIPFTSFRYSFFTIRTSSCFTYCSYAPRLSHYPRFFVSSHALFFIPKEPFYFYINVIFMPNILISDDAVERRKLRSF